MIAKPVHRPIPAYLLTRHWHDDERGMVLQYWLSSAEGAFCLEVPQQPMLLVATTALPEIAQAPVRFRSKPLALRSFDQQPVAALYLESWQQYLSLRRWLEQQQIPCFESDIRPTERYLMERFIRGPVTVMADSASVVNGFSYLQGRMRPSEYSPVLKVVSLDIETAMHELTLYSIAVYAYHGDIALKTVFMCGEPEAVSSTELDLMLIYCHDQRQLLQRFLQWLAEFDPDVLIGWNVVNFDFWFLQQVADRLHMPLTLGRGATQPHWHVIDDYGQRRILDVPGRLVLDGIELLKQANIRMESYSLQAVAEQLLDDSKLLKGGDRGHQIQQLFEQDKPALAAYNLQDCKLVWDIFENQDLLEFALVRGRLTGLSPSRLGGSVAAFDNQYLPRLHRHGYVASPQPGHAEQPTSPGGYVMDSVPGLYEHVLVFDFKSLYPSIIRSFHIDPLGLASGVLLSEQGQLEETVPGFNGACFSRHDHILPGIISELWEERDKAKAAGSKTLSHAIKIIMNSFYGVLGSNGCRFFDPRLASSITRRGHQVIQQSRDWFEQRGLKVVYGDTDSVFVWMPDAESSQQANVHGQQLAQALNRWWRQHLRDQYQVESALEIQFETHFVKFVMPTRRGSEQGSKKRYAGLVQTTDGGELKQQVIFKGLENVRSDWTALARELQSELYYRVFTEQPYQDYLVSLYHGLNDGQFDDLLVYRKRLRQRVEDYQAAKPPHVQAVVRALQQGVTLAEDWRSGDWVEYVITRHGPELREYQQSPLDYEHYWEKQLMPVADGLLHFLNTSYETLVSDQLSMF